MSAEELQAKLADWFPAWRWECCVSGGYCCVFASQQTHGTVGAFKVTGVATERVARARSWEAARNQAKVWRWKQAK